MKKTFLLKSLLLLCVMIVGSGTMWAENETTIAEFTASTYNNETTHTWLVSNADYATAGGGYYKLVSSDASIVTPSINWSNYENITITISARKFGGPDATQGKISVSQGSTELTSYSPSGTSIVASSALEIEPADGTITISCPGASSSKGCGVQSIVIKGTEKGGDQPTTFTVTYDANGATSGSVPTDNNKYEEGNEVTVLDNTGELAKTGCAFNGWNTQANGEGTSYNAGETFSISANTTLYAKWTPYTITSQSNNESYGTVSLSGNVITGSPNTGYRYANPAYTVSPANSATVSQNGNEFTVTPTANTTITINFELIPTHTVTFNVGNGVFEGNDDFPNKENTVAEGGSYTLPSATPPAGYFTFDGWVITGSNTPITGLYTVTDDVEFTAQYSNTRTYNFAGADNFYTDANLTTHPNSGNSNNVGTIYYIDGSTFVASGTSRYFSSASSGYFLLGKAGAEISLPTFEGYKITQVKLHSSSSHSTSVQVSIVSGENTASNAQTWSNQNQDYVYNIGEDYQSASLSVKVTNSYNTQFTSITLVCEPFTEPLISATDPDELAYDATEGEFAYSITNPATGVSLNATSNSDWITNVAVDGTNSKVTFNTSPNTSYSQRVGTITLSYTGAKNKVITITQAAAPYSNIPDLFEAATNTATSKYVKFDNWVVSGVSTDGKNVFVTDGTYGFVIYSTSNQSNTYPVGSILSGTANCSLKLNYGYAQITNLNASDLTITSGGSISAANIALAELAGVNTGALVSYENLTCSISSNKYYLSDGITSIQLYTSLYDYNTTFEDGEKYNITGIYQQYNTTKEILPRSADDIEKIVEGSQILTISSNPNGGGIVEITGKTLVNNACEISQGVSVTATATPAENYTFTSWTAEGITLENNTTNPLTFTMPANEVTLTANFTEKATHTVSFYVNGVKTAEATVHEDEAITFPVVQDQLGMKNVGWSTSTISGTQATAEYVTKDIMGKADIIYYAVFAVAGELTEGLVKMVAGNNFNNGDKIVIVANVDEETAYGLYQETINNSYVKYYVFDGKYETVANDNKMWWTVSAGSDGKWILGDETNGYLYSSGSNNLSVDTNNSSQWTLEDNNDNTNTFSLTQGRYLSCRSDLMGNNQYLFRLAGSTPAGIYKFDIYKIEQSGGYSDYCTTIPTTGTLTLNAACHDNEGKIYGTFYTNRPYIMPATLRGSVVSVDDGKLVVDEVYDGSNSEVVPANTALLISTADNFTGTHDYTITYATGGDDHSESNMLKGTLTADEETEGDGCLFYRLTMHNGETIGFWWGAAEGGKFKPGANKAYLAVPKANAARNGFTFDDEATGISQIENGKLKIENCYDLQGRKVSKPGKGLYIVNGKKVVIK